MSLALLLSLIGIAALDSLNPSLFIAQLYLLTTPKPTARILSYIAGLLLVNYVGGLLLLGGARAVITDLLSAFPTDVGYVLQLAVGVAALVFGLLMRVQAAPGEAKKPRSLRPIHTFLLGMAVMINELTTALPYFVAVERMASAGLNTGESLLALLIYNAVFSLPLFVILGLYLGLRERLAAQIERIARWVQVWSVRLIRYASVVFGAALVANAAAFLAFGAALFG